MSAERVDVDWLIGADGAGSVAGRAIDIPFDDNTDAQQFQLADALTDADLPDDQGTSSSTRKGRSCCSSTCS